MLTHPTQRLQALLRPKPPRHTPPTRATIRVATHAARPLQHTPPLLRPTPLLLLPPLLLLLLVLPASLARAQPPHPPTPRFEGPDIALAEHHAEVHLPEGTVVGVKEGAFYVFRGIPYATARRWERPKAYPSWHPMKLMAEKFGPVCPQEGLPDGEYWAEDCLYLNVWTPRLPGLWRKPTHVMVFIHGGSFDEGAGSQPAFWGDYFANSTDTVLVTFNYRLGAFGFFALQNEGISGNYGLMDQLCALRWVQRTIALFGGDPARTTVFGQSAGALSIVAHLTNKNNFAPPCPLFSRAIVESAPLTVQLLTSHQASHYGEKLVRLVGCKGRDAGACMRSADAQGILNHQDDVVVLPMPFSTRGILKWKPVVDGELLTHQPLELLTAMRGPPVPVVWGTVLNETLVLLPNITLSRIEYITAVTTIFGDVALDVLRLYPASSSADVTRAITQLGTDYIFICPIRYIANQLHENDKSHLKSNWTYIYSFEHTPSYSPLADNVLCTTDAVCHTAELPFVFRSMGFYPPDAFSPAEQPLALHMQTYWALFASEPDINDFANSGWRPYLNSTHVFVFDEATPSPGAPRGTKYRDSRQHYCNFWDGIGYHY